MKTSKFYGDQAQVTKDLTGCDKAVERGWLNAQWKTEQFENAVAKTVGAIEFALQEINRTIADACTDEGPSIMGTDYRSASAVAARIQQRLVEALLNADIGMLTRAAAKCQEAQDAVK